jgi:6-phosphogluconolactonase
VSTHLLFVSCAGAGTIDTLLLDSSGTLSLTASTKIPGGKTPATSMALALSPDRTRLYAAVRNPPYPTASFAIAPDGDLTLRGTANLPAQMAYIATDHTGRHLLGASYHASLIASAAIDADGIVQAPATQSFDTPPKAHSILPSPDNRFVLAASLGGDAILRYRFDPATGLLDPIRPMPAQPNAGPRHLRFSPDGRFLYLINELGGSINAYAYDAVTADLELLQTLSLLPDGVSPPVAAADIHLTPDGRFLYGSERTTNMLLGFHVNRATGTLAHIGAIPSEPGPRGFAIDPEGRFLLCAGQTSNRIGVYGIDPVTGSLTAIGGCDVGANPNWIEFLT